MKLNKFVSSFAFLKFAVPEEAWYSANRTRNFSRYFFDVSLFVIITDDSFSFFACSWNDCSLSAIGYQLRSTDNGL